MRICRSSTCVCALVSEIAHQDIEQVTGVIAQNKGSQERRRAPRASQPVQHLWDSARPLKRRSDGIPHSFASCLPSLLAAWREQSTSNQLTLLDRRRSPAFIQQTDSALAAISCQSSRLNFSPSPAIVTPVMGFRLWDVVPNNVGSHPASSAAPSLARLHPGC